MKAYKRAALDYWVSVRELYIQLNNELPICFAPDDKVRGLVRGKDSAARRQIVMTLVTVFSRVDAADEALAN